MGTSAVIVGNPKPRSRTLEAALLVAERLTDRPADVTFDLVSFGDALMQWDDPSVGEAVAAVSAADVVVVASPTYKASYTGLLKLFLDRFPSGGLAGTVAFPLMLGAGPGHAMAPEVFLKPVLVELGAICPLKGLYLLDSDYTSPAVIDPWVAQARDLLSRLSR